MMLKGMKDKDVPVILAVTVIILAIGVGVYFLFGIPRGNPDIAITGNVIDNDYNNLIAGGNLVRVGDKLYYNYLRNTFSYGLIEISESGAKRILWKGPQSGLYGLVHQIRHHNNQLIVSYFDEVQYYSQDSKQFDTYEPLNKVPGISFRFQTIDDKIIFKAASDPEDMQLNFDARLCIYDGDHVEIITPDCLIRWFYIIENDIYYYTEDSGTIGEFRKYNLANGTDVPVYQFNGYTHLYNFIIEDNYLFFDAQKDDLSNSTRSVYKINLGLLEKGVETVFEGDPTAEHYDLCAWNVYDGKIYIASQQGLLAYDIQSNNRRILYEKPVEECYIVDDTWIYFVDERANLWRVTPNGSILEKVFGW